jgi:pyruvate dehydrogenase E2 component (dihydrolipoamide acetyltransferase)
MPQLGETVTEGTITRWLKQVGEAVERDEPLFEVSTDKVDSEVPSPAGGVVAEIRVPEGETVDVGTVLAVVSDSAAASAPASNGAASDTAPAAGPPAADTTVAAPPAPPVSAPPTPAPVQAAPAPAAAAPAQTAPAPAAPPAGGPVPMTSVASTAASVPATTTGAGWDRVLSPVVRRLINEHGMDPATLAGTGPGGRITRADVLDVIDARATGTPSPVSAGRNDVAPPSTAPGPTAPRLTAPAATQASLAGTDEIIPFTNIRRRTAEHMVRSKATSAHTLVVLEADYENVERTRRSEGGAFKAEEGFSLTYLPFIARATVEALHEWPNLNASVGDDALIVHHGINIGIAVDLDNQGLIVPVVHGAEELTVRGMARRIRDISTRARSKQLSAQDISGGTFTLTNAGPFGTFLTYPIINQPQVGILSTDGVKRRPVVVAQDDGTEAIAIHSIGLLCLAWDHRAVDGAYAAAFVARVVEILATRDWSAEL